MDESRSWLRGLARDWQRRLTALLTLIVALSYVSWFASEESLWWPETVTIVKLSLFSAFALELLPRPGLWFVRSLQIVVILGSNALFSSYRPVFYSIHSMKDFGNWVFDNFWQLHPFVWFGLGAWLVYVSALWWMTSRWRIGILTVVSVLVMAVRDSFSLVTLWEETAMIIFAGLLLLVVRHFGDLKLKNPAGWAYLAEYPGTLLLTVCLLLGMTMVPGLLMPGIRPLVTDPYSAYLQWKGEEVPSFGKTLFGDSVLPSGNSSSGYSRDDSSLGGGFDFDYSPVFSVDTTHRSYWRGETRSYYTGSGWEMSDGDKQASTGAVAADADLSRDSRFNVSQLQTVEVRQTITMLSENETYPVLFGAYAVSKVESINGDKGDIGRIRWSPRQMELRWNGSDKEAYPKTYTVVSQMPVIQEEGLKNAAAELPNRNLNGEYLQLPRSLPTRVRQLALDVTAGAATPYEKAKKLEQYLQTAYPYTNKPKTELGQSEDFADRFLFEIKEGYCDYYSTAMAVLSRAAGIPSRWVKGYVSGNNEAASLMFGQVPIHVVNDENGAGTYTVRNSDAHSWVELYFHGYGWIPFEPTSGFVLPAAQPEAEPPEVPEQNPEAEADTPEAAAPEKSGGSRWVWYALAAVLAAAAGAAGWLFRGRLAGLPRPAWMLPRKGPADFNQRVVVEYSRLMKRYRRKGFPVHDHETARETVHRLKSKQLWLSEDLETLLALFEKAKYSPRGVTLEESGQALQLVEKLKKAM